MHCIQPGDDVTHNGYPLGKLKAIRTCLVNGAQTGIVQIHGHVAGTPATIPMHELKRDTRYTEAAL